MQNMQNAKFWFCRYSWGSQTLALPHIKKLATLRQADGWYKLSDKCVMNIERNRFQTYKYKNLASELAQIDFFEVDVLLLAYKSFILPCSK